MVLLVYLHLTLVVQYNIILIIVKSIYTILLFANKQWGYGVVKQNTNPPNITINTNISTSTIFAVFTTDWVNGYTDLSKVGVISAKSDSITFTVDLDSVSRGSNSFRWLIISS